MKWAEKVATEWGVGVLVGKPTGDGSLRRARCRWYDNIEAYIEEMGWQVVDCIIWLGIRSGDESCEQRYSHTSANEDNSLAGIFVSRNVISRRFSIEYRLIRSGCCPLFKDKFYKIVKSTL